ncbi:MAG: flippase-like domain-containing protein [Deltaproteobacteria bacterium]|nr:flippase-like domain-containing protein [Deltaproteobacteria bacterium]MBI3386899.1 flippase-like domain-containing protein [Deltaproteobacteria bacterium]
MRPPAEIRRWVAALGASALFVAGLIWLGALDDVPRLLRRLPGSAVALAFAWLVVAGGLRAVRLRWMLPTRPPLFTAYAINQIYNLGTAVIPTGLGEVFGVWFLGRRLAVPVGSAAAVLLIGRVLDITILLVMFLAAFVAGAVAVGSAQRALVAIALVAIGIVALAVTFRSHLAARARVLLRGWKQAANAPAPLRNAVAAVLHIFDDFAAVALAPQSWLLLVITTAASQFANLQSLRVLLAGVDRPTDFSGALAIFVVYLLLRVLPVQGLAGVGTHATWWALALVVVGVGRNESLPIGAVLYLAYMVLLVLLCATGAPLLWLGARTHRITMDDA